MDLSHEEKFKAKGFDIIIGVDEAGRGPLAGPVVASAVALKSNQFQAVIRDSKTISPKKREAAFHEIYNNAYVGVGIISEVVIDQINILQATFLAMHNAVESLVLQICPLAQRPKDFDKRICILVDGNQFNARLPYAYQTIVQGDKKVFSIACASIVAKVTRDRIIHMYDKVFPEYGFKAHKGYPTKQHKEVLRLQGLSPIHRKTFKF